MMPRGLDANSIALVVRVLRANNKTPLIALTRIDYTVLHQRRLCQP